MLPTNSITVFREVSGNVTETLVTGNNPKTIIAISMQQSKDLSDTILLCGNSEILAKNYAKDLPQNLVNYQCNDDIKISKTGNDLASVIVSYLPYNTIDLPISTTTPNGYNPNFNIASSSDIKIYGSFSAGEIIISLLLFCLIWIKLLELLARGLSTIKTKKKFLGYHGGDVEIREDN